MLKTATYDAQPGAVLLCPLPDGGTDVWLREDIQEIEINEGEEPSIEWSAQEAYMHTDENPSCDEIIAAWGDWWALATAYTGEPVAEPTLEERTAATEAAVLALMMGGM